MHLHTSKSLPIKDHAAAVLVLQPFANLQQPTHLKIKTVGFNKPVTKFKKIDLVKIVEYKVKSNKKV